MKKREESRLARAHEIEMQSIALDTERAKAAAVDQGVSNTFEIRAPEMPKFDEKRDDIDAYIERFEQIAKQQKWEKPEWLFRLILF